MPSPSSPRYRRVLHPGGVLRLSTPNLDWVWATRYPREGRVESRIRATLHTNRAFYGWGHRFLWNHETLTCALAVTGFRDLEWCRYGESRVPFLRGHVEARGQDSPRRAASVRDVDPKRVQRPFGLPTTISAAASGAPAAAKLPHPPQLLSRLVFSAQDLILTN